MLDVNPETVCRLIELATEFHVQDTVTLPEASHDLSDESVVELLEGHRQNPVLAEFCSIIADLEPGQQQQVVGVFWLGRGDYSLDEWGDALADAADAWNERTGEYLIAHPLLAEQLRDGLELHGYRCDQ